VAVGAFGNETAKAAEAAGLHVDFFAPSKENPSMTSALEHFLKENIGEKEE